MHTSDPAISSRIHQPQQREVQFSHLPPTLGPPCAGTWRQCAYNVLCAVGPTVLISHSGNAPVRDLRGRKVFAASLLPAVAIGGVFTPPRGRGVAPAFCACCACALFWQIRGSSLLDSADNNPGPLAQR
ncbi:hypothetical protein V490_04602 [Pseudogymnoascus sp. VKM F-3557]|nr:hypothetical protein V490_04602 [Pseudogymnoascus sp. VKM F-3557]